MTNNGFGHPDVVLATKFAVTCAEILLNINPKNNINSSFNFKVWFVLLQSKIIK